jgi:outer membrane protein assembly factor BamB
MHLNGETLLGVDGLVITVSALSGRDGKTLWARTEIDKHAQSNTYVHDFREWTQASDGRPLIVVSLATRHPSGINSAGSTRILRGSGHGIYTGIHHPTRELLDAEEVQLADFNGDGHRDLYWFDQPHWMNSMGPTKLHTIAGCAPVMWRRLGDWRPHADFNGDGIIDLLNTSQEGNSSDRYLAAVSGLNGRVLWQNQDQFTIALSLQLPGGDIDGDECADIITFKNLGKTIIRRALSGKTGNAIWTSKDTFGPDSPFGTNTRLDFVSATALDVDMDGSTEIVVLTTGGDASETIVLDAASGEVKWHTSSTSEQENHSRIWTINQSRFQPGGTPSLMIVREEKKKLPGKNSVRIRQTELTLETLDGTTGRRTEKRVATKHEFPLIETFRTPSQTSLDRPHVRTTTTGDPIAARFNGGTALCFAQQQNLVAVDGSDNQLGAFKIPDRLFRHQGRKNHLSAADIDGDGLDELITTAWISNPNAQPTWKLLQTILALKIISGDGRLAHEVLWEWKMPSGFGDIMAIDLEQAGTTNITACSGNTVFKIDARTGVTRWTCDGPKWWINDEHGIPQNPLWYEARRPVVLQEATHERPARVLFRRYTGGTTTYAVDCRFSVSAN